MAADTQTPAGRGFTDEERTLLGHSDLAHDGPAGGQDRGDDESWDEHGRPRPAGFRERLILGDISW